MKKLYKHLIKNKNLIKLFFNTFVLYIMNTKKNIDMNKKKQLYWKNPTVYLVNDRQIFILNNYPSLDYKVITVNIDKPFKKHVSFNLDKNEILNTYSPDEYDRTSIDSILYLKSLQRLNQNEWNNIITELNNFKMNEMISHKDSISNIKIHK